VHGSRRSRTDSRLDDGHAMNDTSSYAEHTGMQLLWLGGVSLSVTPLGLRRVPGRSDYEMGHEEHFAKWASAKKFAKEVRIVVAIRSSEYSMRPASQTGSS